MRIGTRLPPIRQFDAAMIIYIYLFIYLKKFECSLERKDLNGNFGRNILSYIQDQSNFFVQ